MGNQGRGSLGTRRCPPDRPQWTKRGAPAATPTGCRAAQSTTTSATPSKPTRPSSSQGWRPAAGSRARPAGQLPPTTQWTHPSGTVPALVAAKRSFSTQGQPCIVVQAVAQTAWGPTRPLYLGHLPESSRRSSVTGVLASRGQQLRETKRVVLPPSLSELVRVQLPNRPVSKSSWRAARVSVAMSNLDVDSAHVGRQLCSASSWSWRRSMRARQRPLGVHVGSQRDAPHPASADGLGLEAYSSRGCEPIRTRQDSSRVPTGQNAPVRLHWSCGPPHCRRRRGHYAWPGWRDGRHLAHAPGRPGSAQTG
jgi:hypothetical protein